MEDRASYNEHPIGSDGQPRTARRITKAMIDTKLATASESFHRVSPTCIVCCIVLANGWNLIGFSACVDPANFDLRLGQKIAREKAIDSLWALEGYALASEPPPGEVGLRAPRPSSINAESDADSNNQGLPER